MNACSERFPKKKRLIWKLKFYNFAFKISVWSFIVIHEQYPSFPTEFYDSWGWGDEWFCLRRIMDWSALKTQCLCISQEEMLF